MYSDSFFTKKKNVFRLLSGNNMYTMVYKYNTAIAWEQLYLIKIRLWKIKCAESVLKYSISRVNKLYT